MLPFLAHRDIVYCRKEWAGGEGLV